MREIKFRAWCEPNKKYFFTDEMVKDQFALLPNGYFANISGRSTSESVIYTHEQYLPDQSTGLHDKNGKEIYEGDWVQIIDHPENITTRADVVVFESGAFTTASETAVPLCDYGMAWVEVIGNIHENPELAKEFL